MALDIEISADNKQFIASINEMKASLASVAKQVEQQGNNMNQMFDNMKNSAMGLAAEFGLGFSLAGFAKSVVQVRGEFQALETSFTTLLRSEEKANDLMAQLTKTAAITPFDLKSVANGAKQLLAYGMEADKVNDKIIELGNIASGMGLNIDYITQLYGTTVSKSAMDTMDLKQFKSQGIAIDEAIAEVMKVEKEDVPNLITQHKVTGDIVASAITQMAGEGGKFAGMMENQSKTILGQISNIGDAWDSMLNDIGKSNQGIITGSLSGVSYLIENYETIGKVLVGLIATYGAYKTAVMAVSAFQNIGYKAEIEQLMQLQTIVGSTGDAELDLAIKKGQLTEAEAQNILAIREEAKAHAENLRVQAEEAAVAEATAIAKQEAAQKEIQTAQSLYDAAMATGDQEQMQVATDMLNTAVKNEKIAVMERETATQIKVTATEAADTAAQQLNTASKVGATKATSALALAQQKLNNILKATGVEKFVSNPYLLAATAVAALGVAIYKTITYETDLERATKAVSDAMGKSAIESEKEIKSLSKIKKAVDDNIKIQKDEKSSKEEITKAKKAEEDATNSLLNKAKEYGVQLTDENGAVKNLTKVYDDLTTAIQHSYDVKAFRSSMAQQETEFETNRAEKITALYKVVMDKYSSNMEEGQRVFDAIRKAMYEENGMLQETYQGFTDGTAGGAVYKVAKQRFVINEEGGDADLNKQANDLIRSNTFIRDYIIDYKRITTDFEQFKKGQMALFGITEEDMEGEDGNSGTDGALSKEAKKIKGGIDNIIKQIYESQKQLAEARKGFYEGTQHESANKQNPLMIDWSAEDVDAAEKALKEAKDAYEKATGESWDAITANNEARKKAAYDRAEAVRQYEKEQAELDRQFEIEAEKARYELMQDGSNKTLKLLENTQKAERNQLRKAAEERLETIIEFAQKEFEAKESARAQEASINKDTTYVAKHFDRKEFLQSIGVKTDDKGNLILDNGNNTITFDSEIQVEEEGLKKAQDALELVNNQNALQTQNVINAQLKARTDAYRTALQSDKDFYEKYIEIETKYQKDIQELDKQFAQGIITKDQYDAFSKAAEVDRTEQLSEGNITPDIIAQKEGDIQMLVTEITYSTLDQLSSALDVAIAELNNLPADVTAETKAQLQAKINAYKSQIQVLRKNGKNDLTPQQKTIKKWNDLSKVVGESSEVIAQVGDIVGGVAGEILNVAAEIAPAVMTMITSIVTLVVGSSTAMETTSEVAAESIKTVEKASVILAIIGAALQIAQSIANMLKKESTAEAYEKSRANYESYMKILDQVIEKNLELAQSTSSDADMSAFERSKKYYQAAIDTIQLQEEAARKIGKEAANSGAEAGHHSYGYRSVRDMSSEGWQQAAQALGMGVDKFKELMGGRMTGVFDLTSEQLQKLYREAPMFLHGLNGEMKSALDDVIKYTDSKADTMAQILEDRIGYSIESLKEDFTDLFSDMSDDAESFTDNFGEKLKNAIMSSVVKEEFADELEELAKMQNDAMEDGNITSEEYKNIMAKADDIDQRANARKKELKEMYDFKSPTDQEEQQATAGGYETMSEETGSELSGRFSAMYIVQSEHLALAQSMMESLSNQVNILSNGNSILEDMRTLQLQGNNILREIATSARNIYEEWSERIESIDKNIRNL